MFSSIPHISIIINYKLIVNRYPKVKYEDHNIIVFLPTFPNAAYSETELQYQLAVPPLSIQPQGN